MVALEKLSKPRLFTLIGSAILIVIGTALMWNVNHGTPNPIGHRDNWALVVFWIVFLLCLLSCLLKREALSVASCGALLMLSLSQGGINVASFAYINLYRVLNQDNSTSNSRKFTGGGILAYAGIIICICASIRIPPNLNVSLIQKLFTLVTAASGILGVIVLWSSNACVATSGAYFFTMDVTIMTILVILYLIMTLVAGSNWYFSFNLYFLGFFFTRLFLDMFTATNIEPVDKDQIYAGYLFCWFSSILSIIITMMGCWKTEGLMVQAV